MNNPSDMYSYQQAQSQEFVCRGQRREVCNLDGELSAYVGADVMLGFVVIAAISLIIGFISKD